MITKSYEDSNILEYYDNEGNIYKKYKNKICDREINEIYYKNGDIYIGELKGDLYDKNLHGKGRYFYENGDIYTGIFYNKKKNGNGILKYNNKDIYEGNFLNDKKYGIGKFIHNTGDYYRGEFVNDNMEGLGEFFYHNNDHYKGDFKNDKKEGFGEYFFNNNDHYIGHFKNDRLNGYGKMILNNHNLIKEFEGEFKNDYIDGWVYIKFKDGSILETNYINEMLGGRALIYYDNKKYIFSGNMNYGIRIGSWYLYYGKDCLIKANYDELGEEINYQIFFDNINKNNLNVTYLMNLIK